MEQNRCKFDMHMRLNILTVLAIVISMSTISCNSKVKVTPSGSIVMQDIDIPVKFTNLVIHDGIEVIVQQSSESQVKVQTYQNVQPFIKVEYTNSGTITASLAQDVKFDGNPRIKIWVWSDEFNLFDLSGGSSLTSSNDLSMHKAIINLSGGSNITANINASSSVYANLSGGSTLSLIGHTQDYTIEASGGSNIYGYDFSCDYLNITMSGGSTTHTCVNEKMDISMTGGSKLSYKGDGLIGALHIEGGSSLIPVK